MSFTVYLESSTAPENQPSQDFTIEFPRPIPLYGRQYEVALQRASLWNSIFNVDASSYNNNTLSFSHPDPVGAYGSYGGTAGTDIQVVFPDGIYTIDQLSAYLVKFMLDNGYADPTTGVEPPIKFVPNFSTFRVDIVLSDTVGGVNFTITFDSNLQQLLGFTEASYPIGSSINTTTTGDGVADITNGVNQWFIECSLIAGSASYKNNELSNILYSFTIQSPPSSTFVLEPVNRYFVPLDRFDHIERIRMTIKDQLGRIQDFQGEPISYTLHFRPVKEYNFEQE